MRIQMVSLASGPAGIFHPNRRYQAPEELSVELAQRFVASGAARLVETAPAGPVEVAIVDAPEREVLRRPTRSKRKEHYEPGSPFFRNQC
jgi:hypothetical protein